MVFFTMFSPFVCQFLTHPGQDAKASCRTVSDAFDILFSPI